MGKRGEGAHKECTTPPLLWAPELGPAGRAPPQEVPQSNSARTGEWGPLCRTGSSPPVCACCVGGKAGPGGRGNHLHRRNIGASGLKSRPRAPTGGGGGPGGPGGQGAERGWDRSAVRALSKPESLVQQALRTYQVPAGSQLCADMGGKQVQTPRKKVKQGRI